MFLLCVSFTAEIGPGVVPGQLSVDGGQQLRLDLHDAGNRRTFRQHSFPCQDHVGKLVVVTFLFFSFFLDSAIRFCNQLNDDDSENQRNKILFYFLKKKKKKSHNGNAADSLRISLHKTKQVTCR